MKIYIASQNKHKIEEIKAILNTFEVLPFPNLEDIEESGSTFEENSKIKAEYLSRLLPDEYIIADDSGLSVESLNGAPGIYSARYSLKENPTLKKDELDKANNRKLIADMASFKDVSERKCKFECVIALAKNGRTEATFYGDVNGILLHSERGENGFGYDPLFYIPHLQKTSAELTPQEKNEMSHRHNALIKLRDYLEKL